MRKVVMLKKSDELKNIFSQRNNGLKITFFKRTLFFWKKLFFKGTTLAELHWVNYGRIRNGKKLLPAELLFLLSGTGKNMT